MRIREDCLSQWQAEHAFQFDPAPPKLENQNDYIVKIIQEKNMDHFAHFLHYLEPRLNKRVRRFLLGEGYYRTDPERFLDYKLSAVWVMLECLQNYDPASEAAFLTYAHKAIYNAFLYNRMMEEAGSYENLTEYKKIRKAAWLYHQTGDNTEKAISEYAAAKGCSEKTAEEYVTLARKNRNRGSLYKIFEDEGMEDSTEIAIGDDAWNDFGTLWNSEEEKAVRDAFYKLSYKDQIYLEQRNAICMTCDRVSDLATRWPFEKLAWKFENGSNSGAEKAYRRAVEKLTEQLVFAGVLHAVELRKKKNAAIVYEYRADYGGEWGEIQFDREAGTAEILTMADGDFRKTAIFANTAIQHILSIQGEKLQSKYLIPFQMDEPLFTLEKVIRQLVDERKIRAVVLRQKFKPSKNSSVVVYEYCADFDNCWGKLEIDLKKKSGKILTLAEGDTMKSNVYANTAIQKILTMEMGMISRKLTIPFRRW